MNRLIFIASVSVFFGLSGPVASDPASNIEMLSHEDVNYRWAAALNLGELGDPTAIPHLINTLHNDPHGYARKGAARALGMFSGEIVETALLQALADESRVATESIASLGKLKSSRAIPELEEFLDHGGNEATLAAVALLEISPSLSPRAISYVVKNACADDKISQMWGRMTLEKFALPPADCP